MKPKTSPLVAPKRSALLSSVLHTLELCVLMVVMVLALRVLGVNSEMIDGALLLVLSFAAKYARASSDVPVKDFVNQP